MQRVCKGRAVQRRAKEMGRGRHSEGDGEERKETEAPGTEMGITSNVVRRRCLWLPRSGCLRGGPLVSLGVPSLSLVPRCDSPARRETDELAPTPSNAPSLTASPSSAPSRGLRRAYTVVLCGSAPCWAYLLHCCIVHPSQWTGTADSFVWKHLFYQEQSNVDWPPGDRTNVGQRVWNHDRLFSLPDEEPFWSVVATISPASNNCCPQQRKRISREKFCVSQGQ